MIRTLEVNAARMWSALESGFCQATDLAEYVMLTCGLDYRSAYQIVGIVVRNAHDAGLRGIDIDAAMLDDAALQYGTKPLGLSAADLVDVLDPRHIVETRTAVGGAAPDVVAQMAAGCRERAGNLQTLARTARTGFDDAETLLVAAATELVAGTDERKTHDQ